MLLPPPTESGRLPKTTKDVPGVASAGCMAPPNKNPGYAVALNISDGDVDSSRVGLHDCFYPGIVGAFIIILLQCLSSSELSATASHSSSSGKETSSHRRPFSSRAYR